MTVGQIVRVVRIPIVPIVVVHRAGRATDVAMTVPVTDRKVRVVRVKWAELRSAQRSAQ